MLQKQVRKTDASEQLNMAANCVRNAGAGDEGRTFLQKADKYVTRLHGATYQKTVNASV
jgi:hypothetical protein